LAVALVVLYALFATVLRLSGGPLADSSGAGLGKSEAKVGEAFTFAQPLLVNDSGRSVTLESIELKNVDDGIEVIDVKMAPPFAGELTVPDRWPPKFPETSRMQDVDGFEVPSRGGGTNGSARVLVGVRLKAKGNHTIEGFTINYRDRGLRRKVEVDATIGLSTGEVRL